MPLAAAVVARMEDLPRAAVAAVGICVFQQAVFWSYPRSSTVDVGPVRHRPDRAAGAAATAGSGRTTTELGAFVAARQPRPLSPALAALAEVHVARATAIGRGRGRRDRRRSSTLSDSQLIVVAYMAIYGIVAISLVVLTGWAGQISLGQFAFVAVGAGVTGRPVRQRRALDLFRGPG